MSECRINAKVLLLTKSLPKHINFYLPGRLFLPALPTIEIMGKIGEGFRISHNYAVIHPQRAGKNLFVGHGVTIGKGRPDKDGRIYPLIGNNVEIYANAVVFGGITIGDNVKIGAGTVVNRDIEANCTAVGNPCRIIKQEAGTTGDR